MNTKDRKFLRETAIGAMSIAALAAGWYYLLPMTGLEIAVYDWIAAVGFGATAYLAIRWAAR